MVDNNKYYGFMLPKSIILLYLPIQNTYKL